MFLLYFLKECIMANNTTKFEKFVCQLLFLSNHLKFSALHTVFSSLNALGVYFKLGLVEPVFIWSRRLIGARRLLTRCFFLPFYQGDLLSPSLTIAYSMHTIVCYNKDVQQTEHKQYMHNIEKCYNKTILRQVKTTSMLCFFVIHGEENNINVLTRPQINAGTLIKRPRRLFWK